MFHFHHHSWFNPFILFCSDIWLNIYLHLLLNIQVKLRSAFVQWWMYESFTRWTLKRSIWPRFGKGISYNISTWDKEVDFCCIYIIPALKHTHTHKTKKKRFETEKLPVVVILDLLLEKVNKAENGIIFYLLDSSIDLSVKPFRRLMAEASRASRKIH